MAVASWAAGWRARFGLAEICGTAAAVAGFGFGLARGWPLPAAAGLATAAEAVAFYVPVVARTAWRSWTATGHLSGLRRGIGAGLHAVRDQFASAAAAEITDDLVFRPAAMTAGAWIGGHGGPGWLWAGFLAGKALADAAWYATEAHARMITSRLAGLLYRPRHRLPPDWSFRLAVLCFAGALALLAFDIGYMINDPLN